MCYIPKDYNIGVVQCVLFLRIPTLVLFTLIWCLHSFELNGVNIFSAKFHKENFEYLEHIYC